MAHLPTHGNTPRGVASYVTDAKRRVASLETAREDVVFVPEHPFTVVQLSDIHCGDARFDSALMQSIVAEVEALRPDVVVVPGDLTADGFAEQFQAAHDWISQLSCAHKIVVPGNHDARNVGLMHFDARFPRTYDRTVLPMRDSHGSVLILGSDTSKPDLNQGEIGRYELRRISDQTRMSNESLKVLVMHHHLVSVPGTGRERNILWDAGDLLEVLSESRVDLVLGGHRHVPYVWHVNGIVVAMSGTACTHRTRGRTPPSFNIVRIGPEHIEVTMRNTGTPTQRTVMLPRRPPEDRVSTRTRRGSSMVTAAM